MIYKAFNRGSMQTIRLPSFLSRQRFVLCRRSANATFATGFSTTPVSTENNIAATSSSARTSVQQRAIPETWEDPWAHALGPPPPPVQYTKNIVESKEEFKWVRRLLPRTIIPEVPHHEKYPTPSGWRPPKFPPPDLPYFVRRTRHHLFPLYLTCRRDDLDTNTLEYNYVEVVILSQIEGDIFACEEHLRAYLEEKLGHKLATHVNEMQGKISVKGADRSLLEQFLTDTGF